MNTVTLSTKYFKAVRVLKDGRRISSWIDPNNSGVSARALYYHPHRIISAPKGSAGIFLYPETRYRASEVCGNVFLSTDNFTGKVEIYEAKPLAPVKISEDSYCHPTCRVVRIGKLLEVINYLIK